MPCCTHTTKRGEVRKVDLTSIETCSSFFFHPLCKKSCFHPLCKKSCFHSLFFFIFFWSQPSSVSSNRRGLRKSFVVVVLDVIYLLGRCVKLRRCEFMFIDCIVIYSSLLYTVLYQVRWEEEGWGWIQVMMIKTDYLTGQQTQQPPIHSQQGNWIPFTTWFIEF